MKYFRTLFSSCLRLAPRTIIILTIKISLTFKFHHDFEKKKIKTIFQFPSAILYSRALPAGLSPGAPRPSRTLQGAPGRILVGPHRDGLYVTN